MRISSPIVLLLALWPAAAALATDVYRCTGPDGETMFSQGPCGAQSTPTAIGRAATGQAASGLRAAELDWLARAERERAKAVDRRPRSGARPAAGKARGHDCERRRMSLQDINARLRRGYKPAQGERLKQRRRVLEEYIDALCRR